VSFLFFSVVSIFVLFISAPVSADMTFKPQTSDHPKKAQLRKNRKLSSGSVVPLILGSDSEVMIRSNGIQVHDSPEAVPGTNPAKRKASTSTSVSPSRTYIQEVLGKNGSEVDHTEPSDRNMMIGPALEAHPSSGTSGVGLPSLFDPDIPLTPSTVALKENTSTIVAETNWDGDGLVSVMNNSDCKSSLTEVESPIDRSLDIENIVEEMRSLPKLLSPMTPVPGTFRSYDESMYIYLAFVYKISLTCLTQETCSKEVRSDRQMSVTQTSCNTGKHDFCHKKC
jgi:hypothetical protein